MTYLSNFIPLLQTASRQQCDEFIEQILSKAHEDKSFQARSTLTDGQFLIHDGDLWIDDDMVIDIWLIITGDLVISGNCHDSEGVLLVLGDMRCAHMFSEYGIHVWGNLVCGGVSYNFYNDWCLEVVGGLSARALIMDDKCVTAGAWFTDERGDIADGDADAACGLLGFRGDRVEEAEIEAALHHIERAHIEKETYLDLGGLSLTELPDTLFELTWLEALYLSDNQLTGLPESIGRLHNLSELDLRGNSLNSLPDTISILHNLEILDLSENRLTRLPDSIGQLNNLEVLRIENNRLVSLPDSIGQLEKLYKFDLYNNRVTQLPDTIDRLTNLVYLGLERNPLRNLPDTVGSVTISNEDKQNSEQYALTFESEQSLAPTIQCETGSAEMPEAFPVEIVAIINERQAQGRDAFVVPFPSMENLAARWGEDWAWRKRLWYPHKTGLELSPKELRHLTEKGAEWLFELIVSKNLPSDHFTEYLHYENERVRWALAASPDCPEACLENLAKDPLASVRSAVAINRSTPSGVRSELAEDRDWRVRIAILQHMLARNDIHWDFHLLERFAADPEPKVRWIIAALPALPPELAAKLREDSDEAVCERVLRFQPTDPGMIERQSQDPNPQIRLAAAKLAHGGLSPFDQPEHQPARNRILQHLMLDRDEQVRHQAANGWQPFEFYERNALILSQSTTQSIRRILAGLTRREEVLTTLAQDDDLGVVKEVIRNINTTSEILDSICHRMLDAIAEINDIPVFDPTPKAVVEHIGNKPFSQKLSDDSARMKRLWKQLDLAEELSNSLRLSSTSVDLLMGLNHAQELTLFESQPYLTPAQLVQRQFYRHEADDYSEQAGSEPISPSDQLVSYAQRPPYQRFFELIFNGGDYQQIQIAYGNVYCPPKELLIAVKRYIEEDGKGDLEESIGSIAANPALPDEARSLLVGRLKQQHDANLFSGLARNPTVQAKEWLEIATNNTGSRDIAAKTLWLWHGQKVPDRLSTNGPATS
jgi:hypothetical protein